MHRRVPSAKVVPRMRPRSVQRGTENDRQIPLRFSPTKPPAKSKVLPAPKLGSPLRRSVVAPTKAKEPAPVFGKPKMNWRPLKPDTPTSPGSRIGQSKIPVPNYAKDTDKESLRVVSAATSSDSSYVVVSSSEEPLSSPEAYEYTTTEKKIPEPWELPTRLGSDATSIAEKRTHFLNVLGYRDPLFDGEKEFLQDLPRLLARLDTSEWVLKCDFTGLKIQEIYERVSVIKQLRKASEKNGASENEILCLKGWEEDLIKEVRMIQCEILPPHRSWVRHIIDWLWGVNDRATPAISSAADKKKHEFFNLEDTGHELVREGFEGNEKRTVATWADVRSVHFVVSACGKSIIDEYIRRLTRWDGVVLGTDVIQERRMRYL